MAHFAPLALQALPVTEAPETTSRGDADSPERSGSLAAAANVREDLVLRGELGVRPGDWRR